MILVLPGFVVQQRVLTKHALAIITRPQELITVAHIEFAQIRTDISAHFLPIDHISSPFRMSSHGPYTVTLVVIVRSLFGGQRKAPNGALEDLGRSHDDIEIMATKVAIVCGVYCKFSKIQADDVIIRR